VDRLKKATQANRSLKSALILQWDLNLGEREGEMRKPPLAHEWSEDIDISPADLLNQDAEFCRRMKAVIESGLETCPIGVSTEPGTTNPVMADGWKRPPVRF
jgi:hypothetical protein